MNWSRLNDLLRDCNRGDAAPTSSLADLRGRIPDDYSTFLAGCNGLEGFLTPDQYLMLWRAEDLMELNDVYATSEFLPGVVLIGTDGGNSGFGFDFNRRKYVRVPLVGMRLDAAEEVGSTFEDLIESLSCR